MTREEAVARLVLAGFEPIASLDAFRPPYFAKSEANLQVLLWWNEAAQKYSKSTFRVPLSAMPRVQWDHIHLKSLLAAVKLIL